MQLKSIFVKPVDRKIEGVIKADDDESLRTEVEEYVLTNEIEKRLEPFLDAYNNHAQANGVWISGFFGSGKSHLLKMLALLMANREIDGITVVDSFVEKCADNKMLTAAMNKAVSIPSESILFNIDQKADIISKTDIDALLSVFVKVFDEHCGYYGKQAYIAQFERKLDQDGLLDPFKQAFEKHAGKNWEWGRERIIRISSHIDAAYADATGQSSSDVIDKARADYKLSIEDFAEQVADYIERKPKNFRLNFYVDEVGQYIADNTKLMTNLQTVAESLSTRCDGQAWIIVTAQEDMNTVVGEMGKQQSNDFSKIQARFANRMKLTSADVEEVICKRLLSKTDTGQGELAVLYDNEKNNFRTLFDFEGGMKFKHYQDQAHFTSCYPFVPYQFELFQLAIRNLSQHSAFEGKHSSIGERSMLGVFQEVAKTIADHELGEIATFDLMFEGIRSALKGPIQHTINLAEGNLDNPLAIRLIKALFLVKYVQEFKPTVRNLSVLMMDHFDQDIDELNTQIETALTVLVNQVYIQRNGDAYEFLTDEEKDVEQEIKNTDVDIKDVADELSKIVFDKIIRAKKMRYEANKQDFAFTRKLDDRSYGREQDLAVHVISPFHENSENHERLKMNFMGKPELLVVLPSDDRIMQDLLHYKKTDKYISQNISRIQKDTIKRILSEKQISNQHRIADITKNVDELVSQARLYVAGSEIDSHSVDSERRVAEGFDQLVMQTYPNLKMLRGITYTEDKISHYLNNTEGLFDPAQKSEAEMEIKAFIDRRKAGTSSLRTSLKDLTDEFERKSYGWPFAAIMCFVAQLVNRGVLQVSSDSEYLDGKSLVAALKNTRQHAQCLLEPQQDIPQSRIRQMKEFYEQFFDKPASGGEARKLDPEIAASLQTMRNELANIHARKSEFPFLQDLDEPMARLDGLTKTRSFFEGDFEDRRDDLLDLKEDVLDPIRNFMSGSQATLYLQAKQFLKENEANFPYVDGDEPIQLGQVLDDPKCYAGRGMQGVKTALDSLAAKIKTVLAQEQESAVEELEQDFQKLKGIQGFSQLSAEDQEMVDQEVQQSLNYARARQSIPVVREHRNRSYETLLKTVEQKIQKATAGNAGDTGSFKIQPTVDLRDIDAGSDQIWLTNESEVDQYLAQLGTRMKAVIQEGKRIRI